MKRVSFFMMAALFAASSVFVSCNKDEDPYIPKDGPEITVKFGGVDVTKGATAVPLKVDEVKSLEVNYTADGSVKDIELNIGGTDQVVPFDVGVTSGSFSVSLTGLVKGNIPVIITVTDNQGTASEGLPGAISDMSETFTFTIKVEENPLEETDFEFTWERLGGTAATGLSKYGLEWWQSVGTPLTAHIRPLTGNEWYKFESAVYSTVTTKEELKALFTADKKQSGDFTDVNFQTKTYNIVIGTKVGNEYYLINITASDEQIINAGTPTETVRRRITGKSKL